MEALDPHSCLRIDIRPSLDRNRGAALSCFLAKSVGTPLSIPTPLVALGEFNKGLQSVTEPDYSSIPVCVEVLEHLGA